MTIDWNLHSLCWAGHTRSNRLSFNEELGQTLNPKSTLNSAIPSLVEELVQKLGIKIFRPPGLMRSLLLEKLAFRLLSFISTLIMVPAAFDGHNISIPSFWYGCCRRCLCCFVVVVVVLVVVLSMLVVVMMLAVLPVLLYNCCCCC